VPESQSSSFPLDPEEQGLLADPRLAEAITLFNAGDWYGCHDGFEALWHETAGAMRPVLQGILQIAVAELHHERGNLRGATILMGEGLGRLARAEDSALGLDLESLRQTTAVRLRALQEHGSVDRCQSPRLVATAAQAPSVDCLDSGASQSHWSI
jgi:predicted metal-dependent hydrolase